MQKVGCFLGKYKSTTVFLSFLQTEMDEEQMDIVDAGADPGFFLGGGAHVSCSTSTPINHIVFFCRIPVVLENRKSSQGGGRGVAHPLYPPPRSAPVMETNHKLTLRL